MEKFSFPLAGFRRAFGVGNAEAMTACRVLNVAVGNLLCCQCGIKEFRIVVFDHGVVHAVDKEDGWTVFGDMLFQGKEIAQLPVAHTAFA